MEWGTLTSVMELLDRLGWHHELLVLHGAASASGTAPLLAGDQAERVASAISRAAAEVGPEAAGSAAAIGRSMSDDQALRYARDVIARAGEAFGAPS